jgi:hypothetical protein
MAYNFLTITNEVCARLNETPLTSITFPTAKGFYTTVKDSINAALRSINHNHYNYPFNQVTAEYELEAGVHKYSIPDNAKVVDYDTARIVRDDDLSVQTTILRRIKYDEYIRNYLDEALNEQVEGDIPKYIAQTQSGEFVLHPKPNQAYVLELEYFINPVDLILFDDIPTVPEAFKHVIIDGAMYHCYMFRDNPQSASMAQQKFEEGLSSMRSLLVNDYVSISDTRVPAKGKKYALERFS